MSALRIAHLTGNLSHRGYGVKNAVELLSLELERQGNDVRVFGLRDSDWDNTDQYLWRGAKAIPLSFYGPANFGYSPSLLSKVIEFDPDVIHINGLWMYTSLVAPKLRQRCSAKLVISPHGMLSETALGYGSFKKLAAMNLFQRSCFEAVDGFHATAQAEGRDVAAMMPSSTLAVVPNSLRCSEVGRIPMKFRRNKVIAIGRFHHQKGYDILLRAWQLIEADFPDWELEIYGPSSNGQYDKLKAIETELALKNVSIGGAVDECQRDKLLSESKLFVLSSRSENFALTVPEALYCETPVIATIGTPWGGLVEHACGWWVGGEVKSLAKCLERALSIDDAERECMGVRGRSWVETEFSAEVAASKMMDYYVSLLNENHSI